MIVDLERNDLSRVCRPDSVHVEELFKLETFPEVFHLVATVSGILQDGEDAVSCLRACFPGGSITGAPKMRAMELIDQLEDDARGFYTGCLGYFSADGQADFSIIIRTMVRQGDQILYGAGGGITWESNAADEYQELLDKAAFFRRLIEHDPD
jgi:para-aminobenzoate synthetase component 1